MSEIREVIINITLQKGESDLNFGELDKLREELKGTAGAAAALEKTTASSSQQIVDQQVDMRREIEKSSEAMEDQRRTIQDESVKSLESFSSMAEGSLLLTRSMTLFGIESEDSLATVVESLAKVQGGIDLFKGLSQGLKGAVEGLRSFSAVSKLAGGSFSTVLSAVGPVPLVLAGVTSALGIGYAAWTAYSSGVDEAAEANDDFAESEKRAAESVRDLTRLRADALGVIRETVAAQRDLIDLHVDRGSLGIQGALSNLNDLQASILQNTRRAVDHRFLNEQLTDDQKTRLRRSEDPADVLSAAREVQDFFATGTDNDPRVNTLKGLLGQSQDLQSIQERRLSLLGDEITARQDVLRQSRESVKLAEDALKIEEQRVSSIEASIGRLNPLQIAELKSLGDKQKSGEELSRSELDRLSELGGSSVSGFVEDRFSELGRESGASDLLAPFSDGDPLRGEGSRLDLLAQERARMQQELRAREQSIGQELRAFTDDQNRVLALVERLVVERAKTAQKIAEIEDALNRQQVD